MGVCGRGGVVVQIPTRSKAAVVCDVSGGFRSGYQAREKVKNDHVGQGRLAVRDDPT